MRKSEIVYLVIVWFGLLSISLVEFLPNLPVVGFGLVLVSIGLVCLMTSYILQNARFKEYEVIDSLDN